MFGCYLRLAFLDALFQLGARHSLLRAPFGNEFPKLGTAAQLQLLFVHPFNANDERDRLAIPGEDDPLALRIVDKGIQGCLF